MAESESSHSVATSPHPPASPTAGAGEDHQLTDLSAHCSPGDENTG